MVDKIVALCILLRGLKDKSAAGRLGGEVLETIESDENVTTLALPPVTASEAFESKVTASLA